MTTWSSCECVGVDGCEWVPCTAVRSRIPSNRLKKHCRPWLKECSEAGALLWVGKSQSVSPAKPCQVDVVGEVSHERHLQVGWVG